MKKFWDVLSEEDAFIALIKFLVTSIALIAAFLVAVHA